MGRKERQNEKAERNRKGGERVGKGTDSHVQLERLEIG